jgi:hypothetical protein
MRQGLRSREISLNRLFDYPGHHQTDFLRVRFARLLDPDHFAIEHYRDAVAKCHYLVQIL